MTLVHYKHYYELPYYYENKRTSDFLILEELVEKYGKKTIMQCINETINTNPYIVPGTTPSIPLKYKTLYIIYSIYGNDPEEMCVINASDDIDVTREIWNGVRREFYMMGPDDRYVLNVIRVKFSEKMNDLLNAVINNNATSDERGRLLDLFERRSDPNWGNYGYCATSDDIPMYCDENGYDCTDFEEGGDYEQAVDEYVNIQDF